MRSALYDPDAGYYMSRVSPTGFHADFITSPLLSPVFAFALARLVDEFVRQGGDAASQIVDIGSGDGSLIHSLLEEAATAHLGRSQFFGIDRSLARVGKAPGDNGSLTFLTDLRQLPPAARRLVFANELFDALPVGRLVMRSGGLHELYVRERSGELEWTEHPADPRYVAYLTDRSIDLDEGQFADISLEWSALEDQIARDNFAGMVVTFDYGMREEKLFRSRMRRYGTAAAYRGQRVSRDLLRDPGKQDLTAHINFSDLERVGAKHGFTTLFFDSQAKFLLALGATEHELFVPLEGSVVSPEAAIELLDARDRARRLVLPDGIGDEIRVLVQGRGVGESGWSFQRRLF
ncbi:MAG: SAM-dependent methyltransferase [Thermoanaerobaculia bacterium]